MAAAGSIADSRGGSGDSDRSGLWRGYPLPLVVKVARFDNSAEAEIDVTYRDNSGQAENPAQ